MDGLPVSLEGGSDPCCGRQLIGRGTLPSPQIPHTTLGQPLSTRCKAGIQGRHLSGQLAFVASHRTGARVLD